MLLNSFIYILRKINNKKTKDIKVSQTCRIHLMELWHFQCRTSCLTCHSVTLFVYDVLLSNRHVVVVMTVTIQRKEFSNLWFARDANPRRQSWRASPASRSWTKENIFVIVKKWLQLDSVITIVVMRIDIWDSCCFACLLDFKHLDN